MSDTQMDDIEPACEGPLIHQVPRLEGPTVMSKKTFTNNTMAGS
jgi:hypothetical protein